MTQKAKFTCIKWGFFLLSMMFFLVIVIILSIDFPIYLGEDAEFVGWNILCTKGVLVPVLSTSLLTIAYLFSRWLRSRNRGTQLGPVTIEGLENVSVETMSFVASYFFPLVSFGLAATWRHVAVLWILFILIGFIYIRSDVYYINPTLAIFGYRAYRIDGKLSNSGNFKMAVIVK